jgi:hypothetical protein
MASELAHLPARGSARYKGAFVPRRFFNTSLLPFCCTALVPQAAASSTEGYDVTSQKIASSQLPAQIRSSPRQHCLVHYYGYGSALGNDADEVPGFPGSRRPVHATALDTGPLLPSTLVNKSIPTSTRLHQSRQMPHQHVDWLPHQYLGPLPISTVAGFVGRGPRVDMSRFRPAKILDKRSDASGDEYKCELEPPWLAVELVEKAPMGRDHIQNYEKRLIRARRVGTLRSGKRTLEQMEAS